MRILRVEVLWYNPEWYRDPLVFALGAVFVKQAPTFIIPETSTFFTAYSYQFPCSPPFFFSGKFSLLFFPSLVEILVFQVALPTVVL